ncbi:MAG TPA: hypothetical protein VFX98_11010 [Longimicrobiaceae bacterium]|nr:hypothetical protein [Longimicrobiaceae bacterium]
MGVETRSFPNRSADLDRVAASLADWLRRERGFQVKLDTPIEGGRLLKLEKSDFGGHFTGLVYTLEITLQRHDGTVQVRVDDGDLRNQILALGLPIFLPILWPLFLSAGYGWIRKGEIRGDVIGMAAGLLRTAE